MQLDNKFSWKTAIFMAKLAKHAYNSQAAFKKTFKNYVLDNFYENKVGAMPILYKLIKWKIFHKQFLYYSCWHREFTMLMQLKRLNFWKQIGASKVYWEHLIEDLYKTVDRMQQHLDSMSNNKINIEFLTKQMEKAQSNIEKLKDADREIVYQNGNGDTH